MKTLITIVALAFTTCTMNAQKSCETPDLKTGAVLKIASPSNSSYAHINFPKSNFIIKRGGIANYKSLINKKVKVTDVKMENGCVSQVEVELVDGKKFFNTVKAVTVDVEAALEAQEIVLSE